MFRAAALVFIILATIFLLLFFSKEPPTVYEWTSERFPTSEDQAMLRLTELAAAVERHWHTHDEPPASLDVLDTAVLGTAGVDPWGNANQLVIKGDTIILISAGRDGLLGTSRDIVVRHLVSTRR